MDMSKDDSRKPSAKVLQLGFNISVSGDPGTDFQIVLDEKGQNKVKPSLNKLSTDVPALPESTPNLKEVENMEQEVKSSQPGAIAETSKAEDNKSSESFKDGSIISEIKNTMQHFEKFSDHIKEIPRLKNRPSATSTPFADKYTSKSEANLTYSDYRPRRFAHLYDWQSKKEYFKGTIKPLPSDLFLKPLPAENYYRRISRYFDLEPYRHYGSVDSLSKYDSKSKYDRYESDVSDTPPGILKKSDSESGDKLSISSADSVKDIKIYQSGGILIMQNFKETDVGKKEISDFSAKLIENCNRLKEEVSAGFSIDEKVGNSSDELKHSGKMVQFDLSDLEGKKSKSGDSSSNLKDESLSKMESSGSTSDCNKKDTSPQGTFQSQDFPSLSTQENDSVISNQLGTSPTFGAGDKKLEWDSGADVGYLNLDLSKENLSTIEKIVLKGLSSDGISEKKVVFEKKPEHTHINRSKFILERIPSDLVIEEIVESQKPKKEEKQKKVEDGSKVLKLPGDSKPSKENISKNEIPKQQKTKRKADSTDKSVNVNTLFKDSECQSVLQSDSPSKVRPKSSPKIKKLKKKRPQNQRSNITTPLKEKIESIIDIARQSSRSSETAEMGVPKKVYRKVEAKPELQEVELSREMEEIIIDQRFKIKNVGVSKDTERSSTTGDGNKKDTKRPVSASSSSNNTVLNKEVEKKTDQMVQTNECKTESVAIQAFSSQKSSDCDFKSITKSEREEKSKSDEAPKKEKETKQKVKEKSAEKPEVEAGSVKEKPEKEMSSKNIQAFGLNCSLPKQLSHPKESEGDKQNTKSTQFFGGSINSLPNYHANAATKIESCGRMPKILKPKKSLGAEIIRLREENKKNLEKDSIRSSELKKRRDSENKENLITEKANSKKSQSEETKKDDASGKILTSEVLKEHGDSIDRNIIQEKYFQSQLKEIEKREMITKATSMERKSEEKQTATIGCQYSPQSKDNGENIPDKGICLELYDSSQNLEEEQEEGGTGVSLPSSTQTAHSWIPGGTGDSKQNKGIGRAKSFEYLPGHLFESNGNVKDQLPSDAEPIVASCTSSVSSVSGQGKTSYSEGRKDSEGRTTLILENSTANSHDSGPMKILDENLTQLNLIVSKLWEKDAQIQSITQSLLVNLWKRNGCGDCAIDLGDSQKSEVKKSLSTDSKKGHGDTSEVTQKAKKENEISIGCQTEGKSSVSDPERFFEERKALETRISKEKESQIKWIENEIYHLNILRGLLEKQSSSKRRKNHSIHSIVSSDSKSEEISKANTLSEMQSHAVTPVYGVTVSLSKKNTEPEEHSSNVVAEDQPGTADKKKYNVAVSVYNTAVEQENNNIRPVDVQVIVKNDNNEERAVEDEKRNGEEGQALTDFESQENANEKQDFVKKLGLEWEAEPQKYQQNLQQRQAGQENQQQKQKSSLEKRQNQQGTIPRQLNLQGQAQAWQRITQDQFYQRQRSPAQWIQAQQEQQQLLANREKEREEQQMLKQQHPSLPKMKNSQDNQSFPSQSWSSSKTHSLEKQYRRGYPPVPQADMNTQFPSLERKLELYPSTSVQTDFPCPLRCLTCKQEGCVCLDLTGRSFESGTFSSKNTFEKKESPRLSFEKNGDESNKTYSSPDEDLEYQSNQVYRRHQKSGCRKTSSLSYPRTKVIQVSGCRCENSCRRVESRGSKPAICRDPYQSNIYLNYERSDGGPCRCSKVQVQKASCACHIIKILNTSCCSENGTYKKPQKKMEDQFSQTENVEANRLNEETVKDLIVPSEIKSPTKKTEILDSIETKADEEQRQTTDKTFFSNPKISYSEIRKSQMERRNSVDKSSLDIQQTRNDGKRIVGCKCTKNAGKGIAVRKERQEADSHPRHYFLRIEEQEVEELDESVNPKKSLEVITVTVPVKVAKSGKSKPVEPISDSYNDDIYNPPTKLCNCCEDCQKRAYKLVPEEYEEFGEEMDSEEDIEQPEVEMEIPAPPPSKYVEPQKPAELPQRRVESRFPAQNAYEECIKQAGLVESRKINRSQPPNNYEETAGMPKKKIHTRVSSPPKFEEYREQQKMPQRRLHARKPSPSRYEEYRKQPEMSHKRDGARIPSPFRYEEYQEQPELLQKRVSTRVPPPSRSEECREQPELFQNRVPSPVRTEEYREEPELLQAKSRTLPLNNYEECWKQARLLDERLNNRSAQRCNYDETWKQSQVPQKITQGRSPQRNSYEERLKQAEHSQKRPTSSLPFPSAYEERLKQAGLLDSRLNRPQSSCYEESWKPQRRVETRMPKPQDYYYDEDDSRGNEPSSSSLDCYPEKLRAGYSQSGSYYKPGEDSSKSLIENFRRPSPAKEVRSGYCAHRDNKNYHAGEKKKGKSRSRSYKQTTDPSASSSKYDADSERYNEDYYNYNKKEYMTKSELMKEKRTKGQQLPLQEYLASNRPDFYSNAEARRQIISERSKERMRKHSTRMECLMNLIHHCNESDPRRHSGPKRIFTTSQMKEQTMKRYRKLPEVAGKLADEKKKEEYKTNKIMADVYAKKLQLQALKDPYASKYGNPIEERNHRRPED